MPVALCGEQIPMIFRNFGTADGRRVARSRRIERKPKAMVVWVFDKGMRLRLMFRCVNVYA
jgi:hypothetical protein